MPRSVEPVPATIIRETLRANIVRGPKKGTNEWYWRVRLRGHSLAGTTVWVGWGTREEIVEKVLDLEQQRKVSMSGGDNKWATPESVKGTTCIASVERGPRKPVVGAPQWYWRVRERSAVRRTLWKGWDTVASMEVRVAGLDRGDEVAEEAEQEDEKNNGNAAPLPPRQILPTRQMLKVAIVSNIDHAKSVTKALKEEGHLGFNFPDVSGAIPSSMDVIICRTKSISHTAYNICNEERRKGLRPVIFENGVARAVESVRAIANGTWVEPTTGDSSEEDEEGELDPSTEESEKQVSRRRCRESIEEIITKGGLFLLPLIRRSPSQARDALECVTYHKKDRVIRTAVYDAFSELQNFKEATIEEQFEEVCVEKSYVEAKLWWQEENGVTAVGVETVLLRAPLSSGQLQELAEGLTRPGRDYLTTEPEGMVVEAEEQEEAVPVEVPDLTEEVPLIVEEPIVEEEVEPEPEPEPEPLPPAPEPKSVVEPPVKTELRHMLDPEKELSDLLSMLRLQMEEMGVFSLDSAQLSAAGLSGSLEVAIIHLPVPGGVGCRLTQWGRSSANLQKVTCPSCRESEQFKLLTWWAAAKEA